MNGHGSHTYSFINAKNERSWGKFHFKTQQLALACTGNRSRLRTQTPER